eukprot:XP_028341787.1 uncharacterized protein LOC114485152 [Physeter catodon]
MVPSRGSHCAYAGARWQRGPQDRCAGRGGGSAWLRVQPTGLPWRALRVTPTPGPGAPTRRALEGGGQGWAEAELGSVQPGGGSVRRAQPWRALLQPVTPAPPPAQTRNAKPCAPLLETSSPPASWNRALHQSRTCREQSPRFRQKPQGLPWTLGDVGLWPPARLPLSDAEEAERRFFLVVNFIHISVYTVFFTSWVSWPSEDTPSLSDAARGPARGERPSFPHSTCTRSGPRWRLMEKRQEPPYSAARARSSLGVSRV